MPIDDKKNAENKNGDAKKTKETSSSPLSSQDEKKAPLTEKAPPPIKDTPPKTDSLNKKEEKKETTSSKTPPKIAAKDEKPKKKSNLPVFLWPVVCSVITAGGLIGTKDMWMGTTSLNTPQNMAVDSEYVENQQKEIAMLKEQIALLSKRLDTQAERSAQEDKATAQATAETMEPAAAVIENKDEVTPEESEILETGTEEAEATSNEETHVENSAEDATIETSPEVTPEATPETALVESPSPETPMLVAPADDTQNSNDELWQAIDAQKQKIADLQTEISGLQQRSAEWSQIAQQDPTESIKSVEERMTNGENRIQNLEAVIAQLESELALLKKQLAEMQETPPQTALATQFMALDNLTSRIQSGEDYTDALKAFEAASEITNQTLTQNVKGITPLHRLIAEFKPVSHDILTTERKARANEQGNQKQKLLSSFNDLVSISRTDGGAEGSVDRLIYDMEQALENGDVASALALLETTAAQTQEISGNWRQKALNYQNVMQSLAELRDKIADESAATDKAGE